MRLCRTSSCKSQKYLVKRDHIKPARARSTKQHEVVNFLAHDNVSLIWNINFTLKMRLTLLVLHIKFKKMHLTTLLLFAL